MRRIVLAGADLEPEFPFPRLGSADHVKLLLPDLVTGQVALPGVRTGADGPRLEAQTPPVLREYTVRRVDHQARELTIDFVLHSDGPAGRWAAAAAPGAQVGVLGPRGSHIYPHTCASYLLLADETGLPALERFLEELPAAAPVTAVVLSGPGAARELGAGRPALVQWVETADPAAAVAAVAALPLGPDVFAWGAAEAGIIRALRTHLRTDRGLDPAQVEARGYWRHGTAGPVPDDAA